MIYNLIGAKRNAYESKTDGTMKDYFNIFCTFPSSDDMSMGEEYLDPFKTSFKTADFNRLVIGCDSWQDFLQLPIGTRLELGFTPRGKYVVLDSVRVLDN